MMPASAEITAGAAVRDSAISVAALAIRYCSRGAMTGKAGFASPAQAGPMARNRKISPNIPDLYAGRLVVSMRARSGLILHYVVKYYPCLLMMSRTEDPHDRRG